MSRKILTLVLTSIFVLSFGLSAFAQNADQKIEITGATPKFADDINGLNWKVGHTGTYSYLVSINSNGLIVNAASLGLVMYSPDGSLNPSGATVSNAALVPSWDDGDIWDFNAQFNNTMLTGALPELLLYGGIGGGGAPNTGGGGLQNNVFAPAMTWNVTFSAVGVFCVDSAFFPPAAEYLAVDENGDGIGPSQVGGSGDQGVGGNSPSAFCVTTFEIPDLPPVFSKCPPAQTTSHCPPALTYQVTASDPDPENQDIDYAASTTGAGTVSVDGNGNVTYMPDPSDVGPNITITITASERQDAGNGPTSDCVTSVAVTNNSPALVCPADFNVGVNNSNSSDPAGGSDADACDNPHYALVSVTPGDAELTISVDAATGVVSAAAGANAATVDHEVCISYTDDIETVQCCLTVTVKSATPFNICIEQTTETFQGGHELIDITFLNGSETIGGFDFLIKYDNSALSLAGVNEGSIYASKGWEFFDFRYGASGNCNGGCPSGKVRIIGLADQNDGSPGGDTQLSAGDTFAELDFLVSNDRTLQCQFVPIRFCWLDCADNSLSSGDGDTLFISSTVTDYTGSLLTGDQTFPTFTGAPDECLLGDGNKVPPRRLIDFCNGGIHIACAELIDDRGDINLNGISNEIADAVIYTQYFINGLAAFTELSNAANPADPQRAIEAIIAASDVNADGIALSVADLVYLIRVIVGDALPFNKLAHNAASVEFTTLNGVISTDTELGAALCVFAGENAKVDLLADNMNLEVGNVDGNTHALVFDIGSESIAVGEVLSANSILVSVEAVDYNGYALNSGISLVPNTFAVHQNFPNPFNPSTKISFDVPSASEYTVTIYNVAGQKVHEITGAASVAGTVLVEWNASNQASGIYFYNVKTDNASATKKMVLLK